MKPISVHETYEAQGSGHSTRGAYQGIRGTLTKQMVYTTKQLN